MKTSMHAGILAVLCAAGAPAALAGPDLLTTEYEHDERCLPDADSFSLKNRTAFKRGFHGGAVDIEAGTARFSLWGTGMDFATVTVSDSRLSLRKIDTRNGAHNLAKGCPGEYATQTYELTTAARIAGSIRGTLTVARPVGEPWKVSLDVHSSPTEMEVNWDQIRSSGANSGSTRPILVGNNSGCTPGAQGCGGSAGKVVTPPRSPAGTASGGAVTSHTFVSLSNCLREQGGDAVVEAPDRLVVRVPRDRAVECLPKLRADHRVSDNGVSIFARSPSDEVYETRVTRSEPRNGTFFFGIRDGEEVFVGFNWDQIQQRFRAVPIGGTVAIPTTPAVVNAIENRNQPPPPPPEPRVIDAEFEVKVNGRTHAPLFVRVEQMP